MVVEPVLGPVADDILPTVDDVIDVLAPVTVPPVTQTPATISSTSAPAVTVPPTTTPEATVPARPDIDHDVGGNDDDGSAAVVLDPWSVAPGVTASPGG